MAVVNYTIEEVTPTTLRVTWADLHNGDTGLPLPTSQYEIIALLITGTTSDTGTMDLELGFGVDATEWKHVNTFSGFPLFDTTNVQTWGAFRPNAKIGDETTDLTITLTLMPYHKNV